MSISSELLTLNTTKQNIKTAINLKGVTVNDEPFAQYPAKIRLIPSGGGYHETDIIAYLEDTMKNVVIPSGTTIIAKHAFDGMSLTSVSFPNTVTTIDDYAFTGCQGLKTVTLPSGLTTIGNSAFAVSGLTSITIPDSVTTIGANAFNFCSFTYIEIGSGVTSIGDYAFDAGSVPMYVKITATVPPTIGTRPFQTNGNIPQIYVPDNSVLAYQTQWPTYADRIKPISEMN